LAIAKLVIEVNADLKNLQRDLDRATGAIRRMAGEMRSAGTALTLGITLPIAGLAVAVGKAAADMDSLRRGLTAVAGSSKAAQEQLVRLEDVAKLPGLGFREAIQGSIRLQAVGLNVGLAERSLRSFGNAVALTGGGKAELDRITVQLGQLAAKGKVLSTDLRPIIESAPAVGQALRQAFGTIEPEQIQKLHLTSEQFLTRLLDQLDKLPRVSTGVKNSFENLTDSIFRAKVAIGDQLLPVIVPLVDSLTRTLEKVRTLDPNTVRWGIAIAGVAFVMGPLVFIVGQLTAAVTALTVALGIAGLAGTIATGGVLLVLGGLSAWFLKNKLDALAAAGAADTYRASLAGLSRQELESARTHVTLDLMQIRSAQAAMRAAGTDRHVVRADAGPLFGSGTRIGFGTSRRARVDTPDMARLGHAANDAVAKVHALDAAVAGLNARVNATPPLPPSGAGTDKLAGLIDGLTDRLRELHSLQMFDVPSANLLPDNIAEQLRLVGSLADELDTLQDGLKRFQAAGRVPPAGLQWGITELDLQLRSAQATLDALAIKWDNVQNRMLARTNIQLPRVAIGELPGLDRNRLASGNLLGARDDPGSARASLQAGQVAVAASQALSAAFGGLREVVTQSGRAVKEFGASQLRNAISGLAGMAAQLTPAGLAAVALSSAMEALRPALDAVLLPVKMFGEIIAIGVTPVLRLLFPILKALAIVLSYVQEAFDRVIGTLLKGIGWFVRAIGKVINFLDPFGNPGNGLVKLGNGLRDSAQGFFDAADEIKKKRKELQGLTFDGALDKATDSVNRLTEAVLNTVQGFKVARYRFLAAEMGDASFTAPTASQSANVGAGGGLTIHNLNLQAAPGEDAYDFWQRVKAVIVQEARHVPSMRPLAAQLGG
jgi:tape measure domain-containing protein